MKKKKIILATTLALEVISFNACDNIEPDVYGPPPNEVNSTTPITTITEKFNPEDNINQPEYGAPLEDFEETQDTNNVSVTTEYKPNDNIEAGVYGPPPVDFVVTTIGNTTPQEDIQFEPSNNIPQLAYGPEFYNNSTEE